MDGNSLHSRNDNVIAMRVSSLFMVNYTYLIVDKKENKAIIVDPAWEKAKIEQVIRNSKFEISGILLTHSHVDHVNLVKYFVKRWDCPVVMSKREIDYYRFRCNNLHDFNQNCSYMIGSLSVECLMTPGHTFGSACFKYGNNLFTGDTLFIEGCGTCSCKGSNPVEMFESLNTLKKKSASTDRIYPGHCFGKDVGEIFSNVMESNVYLAIDNRDKFIDLRMRPKQKRINFK